MSEELKPCPFCGNTPEIETVGRDWYRLSQMQHDYECALSDVSLGEWSQLPENKQAMIEQWNSRMKAKEMSEG